MFGMVAVGLLAVLSAGEAPPCPAKVPQCKPWEREWQRDPAKQPNPFDLFDMFGPGPHILIVSDGNTMTRVDYATGPRCKIARDSVRRQAAGNPPPGAVVVVPSLKAVCVPR